MLRNPNVTNNNTTNVTNPQLESHLSDGTKAVLQEYVGEALTTGGIATFYLTNDRTSAGAALFTSWVRVVASVEISGTDIMECKTTTSADRKTVTVKVDKLISTSLITALIPAVQAVNGTKVMLIAKGV
ncbi:hypothetical protein [Paenibacillus sp. FSL M7-0896]|uniref:hypothetical protein n=1 Tax=Paenibacillus sp. FSL M7-0896 TaxID=2921610 RepID=UPI0030D891CF